MSNGRSGIRITSAPPASPECRAIQPAWRPITSTIITRLWRLGGGVQAVDRVAGDLHGGVEPERHVGAAEVVVDRLRHADHRQAVLGVQARRGAQRVLAADRDQPVEVERVEVLARSARRPSSCLNGLVRDEPQDRPATRQDPARRLDRELLVGVLERAAPAVAEADDGVPVAVDPLAHDGADHGVQPGTVAASGEHPDPHSRDDTRARQNRAAVVGKCKSEPSPAPPSSLACVRPHGLSRRWASAESTRVEGERATVVLEPAEARRVGCDRQGGRGGRSASPWTTRGSRAGGLEIRLVTRSSTRPGDLLWDPGRVNANAERAAEDPQRDRLSRRARPTAASAVSLPVTNDAAHPPGVAGRRPHQPHAHAPGPPARGPGALLPSERRSFVRLVPERPRCRRALLDAAARGRRAPGWRSSSTAGLRPRARRELVARGPPRRAHAGARRGLSRRPGAGRPAW